MAKTKYIISLVTIIVVSIGSTHGGYYSVPSNILGILNQINDSPNYNVVNAGLPNDELSEISISHNVYVKLKEDEDVSTKYDIPNSAAPLQHDLIYGKQYESVTNPLESNLYKTENVYQDQILSNSIQSVGVASPILQPVQHQQSINDLFNGNIPFNPYNSFQNPSIYKPRYNIYTPQANAQYSSQRDPLQISNTQALYHPLFPNHLNVGIQSALQNNIHPLPLRTSQYPVSENEILVNNNIQNILPSILNTPVRGPSDYTPLETLNSLPVNIQQKPIEPVVSKHIYVHAAPPGFEESLVSTLPPKKTYKIIFIKLPSQESKNTALLQNIYNNYAAREDKTLIYVLVKNPEDQKVIVPQPTPPSPSEHEVIFVKYKNKNDNSGKIISNGAEQKLDDSILPKP